MKKVTTLTEKIWMSLTGLFLCFFLVIHLAGNLLLIFAQDKQWAFNQYSEILSHGPVVGVFIEIISYLLYLSLIAHALNALFITRKNKAAGGQYKQDNRGSSSKWYSRNMGLLGTILLLFLVIHFKDFWYIYKFKQIPLDTHGNKDLYSVVVASFGNVWYIVLYEIAFIALGYHLLHGFFSAFRTLGLYHPKYVKIIQWVGWLFTLGITLGFMIIPIYIYFTKY